MRNIFFSPMHLAVLTGKAGWKLISSCLPEEIRPVKSARDTQCAQLPSHAHSHREIVIVLSGGGYRQLQGKSYPVTPGTVMLLEPGESHQLGYPSGHPPAEDLWLFFVSNLVHVTLVRVEGGKRKSAVKSLWNRAFYVPELGVTSPRVLFPRDAKSLPPESVRWRCLTALELLLASIAERGYGPQAEFHEASFQASVVSTAVQRIEKDDGRDCSVENLSHLTGYSPSHFARLFREFAGMSVRQYVDNARTAGLQRMLAEREPLKSIAAKLGFAHVSALCRWRRRHGV